MSYQCLDGNLLAICLFVIPLRLYLLTAVNLIIGFQVALSRLQLLLLLKTSEQDIAVLPLMPRLLLRLVLEESVLVVVGESDISTILFLSHFLKLLLKTLRVIPGALTTLVIVWKLQHHFI